MDIIISDGRLTLKPVPGEDPDTRVGYVLEIQDTETGIKVVTSMPYDKVRELGVGIVADTDAHPAGGTAPGIQLADESALRLLDAKGGHLAKGGRPRHG